MFIKQNNELVLDSQFNQACSLKELYQHCYQDLTIRQGREIENYFGAINFILEITLPNLLPDDFYKHRNYLFLEDKYLVLSIGGKYEIRMPFNKQDTTDANIDNIKYQLLVNIGFKFKEEVSGGNRHNYFDVYIKKITSEKE